DLKMVEKLIGKNIINFFTAEKVKKKSFLTNLHNEDYDDEDYDDEEGFDEIKGDSNHDEIYDEDFEEDEDN
ncbi:hypothetical protein ACFLYH_02520, partial [Candidatus Dependentiae bacterium]